MRFEDLEGLLREHREIDAGAERLDEGLFDRFRNFLSRKLGGDVSKADRLLNQYAQAKQSTLLEIGKMRSTVIAARQRAEDDPKYANVAKEQAQRTEEAILRIRKAEQQKLDATEKQINLLLKGKSERLKTYIASRKAEIDWISAQNEVQAAKKYASEEEITQLEEIRDSTARIAKEYADIFQKQERNDNDTKRDDIDIEKERERLGEIRNRTAKPVEA